jgi:hypothetical protein
LINNEVEAYRNVDHQMISKAIERYFISSNCSTLNYLSTRKE